MFSRRGDVNKWAYPFGNILGKSIERFSHKMHEDMAFLAVFSEKLHSPITSERKKL